MTTAERFLERIERVPFSECWYWTGSLTGGYGNFWINGKNARAHRFAYESFVGPVPPGLQLDHLCRERSCVRPDHLEPVDTRTNSLRGVGHAAINAAKTHCLRGHALVEGNLRPQKPGRKFRACIACSEVHIERRRVKHAAIAQKLEAAAEIEAVKFFALARPDVHGLTRLLVAFAQADRRAAALTTPGEEGR